MDSKKPRIHIQNIFEAVSPKGIDIKGDLLSRCRKLMNRAILQASDNDVVLLTDDCPIEYIQYISQMMNLKNVSIFRIKEGIEKDDLNVSNIFRNLIKDKKWDIYKSLSPVLNPYMKTTNLYQSSLIAGLKITDAEISSAKATEFLYNKIIFYQQCEEQKIKVLPYYVSHKNSLIDDIFNLFNSGLISLYIRPAKSGGGVGNLQVEHIENNYKIINDKSEDFSTPNIKDFINILRNIVYAGPWSTYIITEVLDLYASPGTVLYFNTNKVHILGHTLQMLNINHQFQGFQYPIKDPKIIKHFEYIEECIFKLSDAWLKKGFKGYGNIDWMVTNNDECFIAEFNPRQTSVISPFSLAYSVLKKKSVGSRLKLPDIFMITNDYVNPNKQTSFNMIIDLLKMNKLHYGQQDENTGVLVSIPPLLISDIKSFGIVAIAKDEETVNEVYSSAMKLFKV